MKKKLIFIFISSLFLVYSCKESTTQPPTITVNDKYFPLKSGSSFIFNLEIEDSNGIINTGIRSMWIENTSEIEETTYYILKDSLMINSASQINASFIRETNSGIFSYADTAGLNELIPDSLRQFVMVDKELRLLFYPLIINQVFPVYTISVTLAGLNVVDLDAQVESEENINLTLNNTAVQVKTFKIRYSLKIRFGLNASDEMTYESYGWAVKDLGFIKWDGDSEVLNFLLNGNIFPLQSNVKIDMTNYEIP